MKIDLHVQRRVGHIQLIISDFRFVIVYCLRSVIQEAENAKHGRLQQIIDLGPRRCFDLHTEMVQRFREKTLKPRFLFIERPPHRRLPLLFINMVVESLPRQRRFAKSAQGSKHQQIIFIVVQPSGEHVHFGGATWEGFQVTVTMTEKPACPHFAFFATRIIIDNIMVAANHNTILDIPPNTDKSGLSLWFDRIWL